MNTNEVMDVAVKSGIGVSVASIGFWEMMAPCLTGIVSIMTIIYLGVSIYKKVVGK